MALICTAAGSVVGARPELSGQRERALRLAAVTASSGPRGVAAAP
jgi:hypothetical protein